jgi:hypothetical protein
MFENLSMISFPKSSFEFSGEWQVPHSKTDAFITPSAHLSANRSLLSAIFTLHLFPRRIH